MVTSVRVPFSWESTEFNETRSSFLSTRLWWLARWSSISTWTDMVFLPGAPQWDSLSIIYYMYNLNTHIYIYTHKYIYIIIYIILYIWYRNIEVKEVWKKEPTWITGFFRLRETVKYLAPGLTPCHLIVSKAMSHCWPFSAAVATSAGGATTPRHYK